MKRSELAEIMRKCPGAKIVQKKKPKIKLPKEAPPRDNQSGQRVGRNIMYKNGEWIL